MPEPEPIRAVVGRNVHGARERQAMTAEELARRARVAGLNWSTSRVFDLENGRKPVSLAELLVLAQAFTSKGHVVTLADLLAGADSIEVTDKFHITGENLRQALTGGRVVIYPRGMDREDVRRARAAPAEHLVEALDYLGFDNDNWHLVERAADASTGAAEDKAARTLGVSPLVVLLASVALWGRSLTEQRDALVEPGGTPQARGHVTRSLVAELGEYIKGRRGDD